jgi:Uma2 family endonuclease
VYGVDGKAEIAGGEIVLMSPTGMLPSFAAGEILAHLRDDSRVTEAGHALTGGAGFIVNLPNRRSFSPDAAFAVIREWTGKYNDGAPLFAVEVRSDGDDGLAVERAMAAKRADYFDAGTVVVWDVDVLDEEVVRGYRAANPTTPTVYRRGGVADAEPALPGWSMQVNDLLPSSDPGL